MSSAFRDGLPGAPLLVDLTLVVPTYNRHDHLVRLLNYYVRQKVGFSVLVLDSSEQSIAERNVAFVQRCGDRFRYERFSSSVPVAEKLMQGIARVQTGYCALCADDDLVFVDGLRQAQEYLHAHAECVCVDGIYLNFLRLGSDLHVRIEYASEGIEPSHPCARVFRLFQRYESLFYGVFRTRDLSHMFSGISRIPTLHYQELFQATTALLIGKSHRLDKMYAGRQHCDPAEPTRDKWQTYYWFAENRVEFLDHYCAYRAELADFYQSYGEAPRLTSEQFEKAMDLAHATFFGTNCPPEYFFNVLQPLWPNDSFKKITETDDDLCSQLKPMERRRWESRIKHLTNRLNNKIQTWYSKAALATLNAESRAREGTPWNCVLPDELKWLADVGEFRGAYKALCHYFDTTQPGPQS